MANLRKLVYSLVSAIFALILFSPYMFKMTRKIIGPAIATKEGMPRVTGLVLHTVVLTGVLFGYMKLLKMYKYTTM